MRGSGRVPRLATPVRGYPYTWAGSAADAWAGAVDTTGRNHEELEGTGRPGERMHMTMAGWDAPEQSPYVAPREKTVANDEPCC